MSRTKIPWTDASWNPIRYEDGWMCTKVSPGCWNCYAESMNLRFGNNYRYGDFSSKAEFSLDEDVLNQPLHWHKPRHIFVQSMGDLFHKDIPFEWIDRIMAIIALHQQHIFQVLTKRPDRMEKYFGKEYQQTRRDNIDKEMQIIKRNPYFFIQDVCGGGLTLPNLWLGVSVETEKYLCRVNALNEIPAAIRFVSLEPLLEEMHIEDYLKRLQWVICGPETGSRRRPCKREWIESIIKQCDAAGLPVFVKALPIGKRISHDPAEWPEHLRRQEKPK